MLAGPQDRQPEWKTTWGWSTLSSMPDRMPHGGISRAVLAGTILLLVMVSAVIRAAASRPHWYQEVESLGVHVISARELKSMLDRGESMVIIDARTKFTTATGASRELSPSRPRMLPSPPSTLAARSDSCTRSVCLPIAPFASSSIVAASPERRASTPPWRRTIWASAT